MTLTPNYLMILLAALTFMCVWLVIPYSLNTYNTEWLPRWIRPCEGIIDTRYPYYYPANESRAALATVLFLSFVCTVVAIADPSERALNALFCLHAVTLPSYLQHRYYCFHKVNQFTQYSLIERKYTFIVYRKNYVFLLWLCAGLLFIAALLHWLPGNVLYLLTLLPSAIALLYVLDEFIVNANDVGWRKCLAEWMPENYYLLFALLGIGLTQAALWQHSVLLLIAWIVVLMAFTVMEFYFRFCSDFAFDQLESWSTDKSSFLLTTSEELALIRRKEERAMHRRGSSWWLLITRREDNASVYKMELTADLENKQREMMLCHKQLLYLRKFLNPLNAWAERSRTEKSPEKMERLIHDLNPRREDLNGFDIDSLRNYNSQDEEIERDEEKMKYNNMKKITLLLLLLFSFGQLKAQVQEQRPFREVTNLSPWYVGMSGGVPFGVSTFSSFGADKTRGGYNVGVYGGYRFNPVLSLELSMKWGQVALSAQDCCIEKGYWLGEDGMRYHVAVAAMNGWDYSDLKSHVTLQQYGVQFNVNVLGFFEHTKQSRWTLEVSPLLAAVSTKATIKTISDNQKALQGSTAWHLGAGGNLQAGYRMTQNLSVAVYSGMTYLSGNRMDGAPQYLHKNNFLWESGVRLGWTFGKGGKQKRKPTETIPETAVAPQRVTTELSVGQEKAETIVSATETKAKEPLTFPTLYFEFNSTSIAPSEQAKLQVMLELLQQHPDAQITVTGWCDTTGTTAVNQRISLRRAETVKTWLTTNGIAASRITAVGSGSDYKETNAAKARRTDTTDERKEKQP